MLKLQYFGHLMQRYNSLEKTLMLGKIEGKGEESSRGWDKVREHHWLNGHEFEQRPWCWERLKAKEKRAAEDEIRLESITDSMDMNLSKLQEIVKDRGVWHDVLHGVTKKSDKFSNWTTLSTNTNQGKTVLCFIQSFTKSCSSFGKSSWQYVSWYLANTIHLYQLAFSAGSNWLHYVFQCNHD